MTNLMVLMYHRVADSTRPGSTEHFYAHLEQLIKHYPVVLPGQALEAPMSVCLTFDDAYYDFYTHVFPALKAQNVPAVLGIPTQFIQESTDVSPETRLTVPYPAALEPPYHREKSPLCTWAELKEMAGTGLVRMASHSASHCHLARDVCDLEEELVGTKEMIEARCDTTVDTFIYPFGNLSRRLAKQVGRHYPYSMRIGGALNRGWSPLLYRVDADAFWPDNRSITPDLLKKYSRRYWFNRLRGK